MRRQPNHERRRAGAVNTEFETAPASIDHPLGGRPLRDSLVLAASFEDVVVIDLATKVGARGSR